MSLMIKNLGSNSPQSLIVTPSDLTVKLDEIDPYSLDSLQLIMDQRLKSGLKFSIVLIREEGHQYFVEASSFMEQFLRGNNRNPLTNNSLDDFSIYTYDTEEKSFKLKANRSEAENPLLYLEILYNDHRRDLEARLSYLHKMGCLSIKDGLQQGYEYLTQAAQMGFVSSQKTLALLLLKENKHEEGTYWFRKYLEYCSDSPADLIFFATQIKDENCLEAFSFFEKAALMGNYLAIANVVDYYEEGRGVDKDALKAKAWRQTLPPVYQKSSMTDFISYLKKTNYNLDSKKV
ncbi:MAG: sel1 repeat family protein [Chlamydiia bacterium]|nr:sel1 repeat family protein [Chlamydiia bacterium]